MSKKVVSKEVDSLLQHGEGATIEERIAGLVLDSLSKKLRECEEEIYQYEVKYGMSFVEFKRAWEKDKILNKYSHEIERDFMIWEGLEVERKKWLAKIRKLHQRRKSSLIAVTG